VYKLLNNLSSQNVCQTKHDIISVKINLIKIQSRIFSCYTW